KNQIRILKGEAPSCMKPSGLAVEYTGGTTATVSWTSEASAWNMKVNGVDVAGPITNPYTLTGLELATDYAVTVQADCGETQSDWTTPVNFTTDECMNPVIVNYALTDAYGDGWNGASISVLDEDDHEVENLTVTGSSSSGTLKLCGYHAFVWNSGSYDDECSFTFTDAIAQPLASGTGDSYTNGEVIFTIGILTCPKPTNLAASEIFGRSAKLSWTENGGATEWVVAYKADGELNFTEVSANTNPFTLTGLEPETDYTVKVKSDCEVERWSAEIGFTTDVACPTPSNIVVTPTPFTAEVSWLGEGEDYDLQYAVQQEYIPSGQAVWLQYDNNTYATGIGSNTSGNWTWGVMYPASMLEGKVYLNKVGIYETATYYTSDYTVRIYSGGDDAPETLLGTENVTPTGTNDIHEVLLSSPITIDPAKNLWIVLNVTGTYVLSACETTESNNQWVYDSGSWVNIGDLSASLDVYGWMIRGLVDNIAPEYDWTTKTNVDTPYTITGLTPETTYAVRIKSNCGGDGNSEYSAPKMFTTPSNCTAPYDLEAEPLDESATLSWTGYQDKFNVRYRTAGYYDPIWEDNFENGLNQWTIIAGENAEAVGANAVWYANNPTGGLSFPAYSGDYCASSWSWSTNAYYANNWLITPQLDLQGVVKYYVRTNADYPDKYEVLLSTTTAADTTNFNVTLKAMATAPAVADWTEVIIDLKDYEGQQGYIAIHHLDYDMNYLLIDDFGIYTVTPAGAWTTLNNQNSPVDITTVSGTKYEWQVQGINEGCVGGVTAWSDMASFTTYNQVYDDEEWSNGETTIDDDVLLIQDVIIPDGVVAYANSITLEPGAHLIIEDGGQLYTNEPVVATVQKELATPSKTAANWYTISSPANNIAPGAVTNLIQGSTDDYDLYLYNEPTTTWLNQKNDANIAMFANLTNGRGYLYWNSTGADLSFTGTLNVDDVNIALTKTGSDALAGFNLIGNPFSHNIYKGTGGAIESTKLAEGFYVLDNTGTWGSVLAYTTPIKPCQGILVQATESFNLTIANSTSPATGEKRSNDDNIMFVVNNSQFEDAAYALFNDGIGLTKINHRNADAPMLFIPQDGENYAIATMGDDTETFGLNFKAMTTGMYTLSAKADGNYSYLHVIDRLTGEDIDMLVDGKYEFIGSPRDNEARFIVKLRYNANGFDNDEFIYQNGDELIVNGEGELQVYDIMGRYVASYNVNGNKRISAEQFSNAVYIFRLIGSDVKTQKIVVR
ncbi:MAG: choice-of-anchor J domain-containing protein, partial [Bacteroidales bacterium]|nr:choice-of-anchor J domain-containing protein [Bacteroidales bacterium]